MTRLTISSLFRERIRYWARLLKSRRSGDDDAMIARDYDQLYWDEIRAETMKKIKGSPTFYAGPKNGGLQDDDDAD